MTRIKINPADVTVGDFITDPALGQVERTDNFGSLHGGGWVVHPGLVRAATRPAPYAPVVTDLGAKSAGYAVAPDGMLWRRTYDGWASISGNYLCDGQPAPGWWPPALLTTGGVVTPEVLARVAAHIGVEPAVMWNDEGNPWVRYADGWYYRSRNSDGARVTHAGAVERGFTTTPPEVTR